MSATGSGSGREVAGAEIGLRWNGRLKALGEPDRAALFERRPLTDDAVRRGTAGIVERVRRNGDAALFALARELDGVELDSLEVPRSAWRAALDRQDRALVRVMERALANLGRAHAAFAPVAVQVEVEPGVVLGRRPDPLARVGVYAPGGRAAYPSSVLMGVVPARVAGVREILLASPPQRGRGAPSDVVLAAAELAGVTRVFALGGAGAIAAFAFGTASVPAVDRVVGPGNAWVAEAKRQLAGLVPIDSPAGPSEILVLADANADARGVAREMIAQAEHDPDACAIAVVVGEAPAAAVREALAREVPRSPRAAVVRAALDAQGGVLEADTLNDAIAFANDYAAEHLLLVLADPDAALARTRCAGAVFVGAASSVPFGDYLSGGNHVLPTGGAGRAWSGLSTLDFVRWTAWQRITQSGAASLADDTAVFAEAEGLPGHAAAARAWSAGGAR